MFCRNSLKSIVQGFLPGIALKIFLILLPTILMTMSKIEGHTSLSGLDRRTASKYYLFLFVNVFLGSVITGTAFQQLNNFIHQSANKYAESASCFLHYDILVITMWPIFTIYLKMLVPYRLILQHFLSLCCLKNSRNCWRIHSHESNILHHIRNG